jgi:hypothetical protein
MKTKEEILNKHDSSRKYIDQTCRPELFAAMDEYAKQQAIAFAIAYATSKMNHSDRTPPMEDRMGERYEWWLKNDGTLGV